MQNFIKRNYFYFFIVVISFIIRAIYGYYSWYIQDHARIFDLGFKLYKYNIFPTHGSPVLLSNSVLPGSLQGILAAIPLYFSAGHPYGIILFVQLLSLISTIIIAKMYIHLFENINRYFIFSFIVLNPMSIISSFAWNPSFLLIFSTLFFLGLVKIFQDKNSKIAQFYIYFPHLFILQLHLQFTILVALVVILIYKKLIPFPNIKIFLLAQIPGLATLYPSIIEKINSSSHALNAWNQNGNILNSVEFHPLNIFSYFHILARLVSFATGDVSHSLGEHFIKNTPWVWVFYGVSMIGTAIIFIIAICFFISKVRWKKLIKPAQNLTIYEKIDFVTILCPLLAAFLFVFSIASMSSHKIWSLFPLCFYPFFRIITLYSEKIASIFRSAYKFRFQLFVVYIFSSLLYSSVGASYLKTNFKDIITNSKNFCMNTDKSKIDFILNNEWKAEKEEYYTYALMCQYYQLK